MLLNRIIHAYGDLQTYWANSSNKKNKTNCFKKVYLCRLRSFFERKLAHDTSRLEYIFEDQNLCKLSCWPFSVLISFCVEVWCKLVLQTLEIIKAANEKRLFVDEFSNNGADFKNIQPNGHWRGRWRG